MKFAPLVMPGVQEACREFIVSLPGSQTANGTQSMLLRLDSFTEKLAQNVRSGDGEGNPASGILPSLIADHNRLLQGRVLVLENADGQITTVLDPLDRTHVHAIEFDELPAERQHDAVRVRLEISSYSAIIDGEKKSIDADRNSFLKVVIAASQRRDPNDVSNIEVSALRGELADHVISHPSEVATTWGDLHSDIGVTPGRLTAEVAAAESMEQALRKIAEVNKKAKEITPAFIADIAEVLDHPIVDGGETFRDAIRTSGQFGAEITDQEINVDTAHNILNGQQRTDTKEISIKLGRLYQHLVEMESDANNVNFDEESKENRLFIEASNVYLEKVTSALAKMVTGAESAPDDGKSVLASSKKEVQNNAGREDNKISNGATTSSRRKRDVSAFPELDLYNKALADMALLRLETVELSELIDRDLIAESDSQTTVDLGRLSLDSWMQTLVRDAKAYLPEIRDRLKENRKTLANILSRMRQKQTSIDELKGKAEAQLKIKSAPEKYPLLVIELMGLDHRISLLTNKIAAIDKIISAENSTANNSHLEKTKIPIARELREKNATKAIKIAEKDAYLTILQRPAVSSQPSLGSQSSLFSPSGAQILSMVVSPSPDLNSIEKKGGDYIDAALMKVLIAKVGESVVNTVKLTDKYNVEFTYTNSAPGNSMDRNFVPKTYRQDTLKELALGAPWRLEETTWLGKRRLTKITPENRYTSPPILAALRDGTIRNGMEKLLEKDLDRIAANQDNQQKYVKEFLKPKLAAVMANILYKQPVDSEEFTFASYWGSNVLPEKLHTFKGKVVPGIIAIGIDEKMLLVSVELDKFFVYQQNSQNKGYGDFLRLHLSEFDDAVISDDETVSRLEIKGMGTGYEEYSHNGNVANRGAPDVFKVLWDAKIAQIRSNIDGYVYTTEEQREYRRAQTNKSILQIAEFVLLFGSIALRGLPQVVYGLSNAVGLALAAKSINSGILENADRGERYRQAQQENITGMYMMAFGVFSELFGGYKLLGSPAVAMGKALKAEVGGAIQKGMELAALWGKTPQEKTVLMAIMGIGDPSYSTRVIRTGTTPIEAVLNAQRMANDLSSVKIAVPRSDPHQIFLGGDGKKINSLEDLSHTRPGSKVIISDGNREVFAGMYTSTDTFAGRSNQVLNPSQSTDWVEAKIDDIVRFGEDGPVGKVNGERLTITVSEATDTSYRTAERKIAEDSIGTVYILDEKSLMKDYSGTVDEIHSSRLESANKNAKALRRLYGDDAATVIIRAKADPLKAEVSIRMIRIPGDSLASFSVNANENVLDRIFEQNISQVTEELVEKLRINGIDQNDFNLRNIMFDPDTKKFNLIDFDTSNLNPINTPLNTGKCEAIRRKLNANFAELKMQHVSIRERLAENRLQDLFDERNAQPGQATSIKSMSQLKEANFVVPNKVYRAHPGGDENMVKRKGLQRAPGTYTSGDEYLSAIIQHSARTGGSGGEVLSLTARKSKAVSFGEQYNCDVYTINTTKDPSAFRTMPDILLMDGERLVREGKVTKATLFAAIDKVHLNEHEIFYVKGDIPEDVVDL